MISVKYEIRINEVPRTYRDGETIALEAARHLKMSNVKDEVKLVDMSTRRWAMIVDDMREPIWREPVWEPEANAKPI